MAVVALDVGGTTIKGAVVDEHGVRTRDRFPTRREAGPQAVVDAIVAAAEALAARAATDWSAITAAGVVVPGIVDEDAGMASNSVTIGWRSVPLRDLLRERIGLPIAFGHDVRAAALAEAQIGAAAAEQSALFVAIGTGIGGAIIADGAVLSGAGGYAGELGQVLVDALNRVRLEDVASAHAIGRRYASAAGLGAGRVDAADVVAAAQKGDPIAVAVWNEALTQLAEVVAAAVAVIDPAVVVVGGGLSRAGDVLLDPLRAGVADRLPWRSPPRVVAGRLLDDAGWVGAALLALQLAGERTDWVGLEPT